MHFKRSVCEDNELSTFDDVGKNPGELHESLQKERFFIPEENFADEELVVDAARVEDKNFCSSSKRRSWIPQEFAGYLLRFHHPWKKSLFCCISTIIGYITLFAGAQA
jgi:hypothetical protein